MPPSGVPPFKGTNPFAAELAMPCFQHNEFETYDADDNLNASEKSMFDLARGDNLLDTALFLQSQNKSNGAKPGQSLRPSHRSSSSSASLASADSNSPKTSPSSPDAMTADEAFGKWMMENDARNGDSSYVFDLDPMAMDLSNVFDFDSASCSPSPGTNGPTPEPSGVSNTNTLKAPAAKRLKGHHKSQSVRSNPFHSHPFCQLICIQRQSLTSSMNGLKTSGSRETSPMSIMGINQEHSPPAIVNNLPASENNASRFNGNVTHLNMSAVWSSMPNLQTNGSAPQVRQDPMSLPAPTTHGHPTYSPQMSLGQNPRPRLVVHPTPLKSRVETQIPIKLTLHHLPPGIKRVHLPTHTISKPKLLAKPAAIRSPDMLELYTMLVCTSAMQDPEKRRRAFERAAVARHDFLVPNQPDDGADDSDHRPQNGGEVRICSGCITRERKRAGRKKHKKPEEEELWNRYEHQRVIVFNTQEVKEWQAVTPLMADPTGAGLRDLSVPDGTVQVDAPMRIACYCRHHGEKMGFQVIFTVKDYKDNVVAQQISSSIMITDDHKTHLPTASAMQCSNTVPSIGPLPPGMPNDLKALESPMTFQSSQPTPDIQGLMQNGTFTFTSGPPVNNNPQAAPVSATPRNLSRQGSPTSPIGPLNRKRKASGSVKVPSGLTMTKLETSQSPSALPSGVQNESAVASAATSPFTPNMSTFPLTADPMFSHAQQTGMNGMGQHFPTGPPTPNSNSAEQLIFPSGNRNVNLDSMTMPQLFSAPTSTHPSRAPSPNRLRHPVQNVPHAALSQNLFNSSTETNSGMDRPMIYKIIPGEGPKSGGVEVTILGSGFTNGGLEVMFGEQRAATTTFWGETSLVCLLPPSSTAGLVPVSIRKPGVASPHPFSGDRQALFRYVDDDEHRLIRTALTVLGNKLGGKITDVADIARNIIYGPGSGGSWGPSPPGSQTPSTNFSNLEQDLLVSDSVETGLLRILELIDLDDSANKARINLRRSSGQTMLHLACSLGLVRFVAGLLSRGANVGIRDKGGFTPLHFAAMNDHPEIVRRLIMKGADPNMRSLSGLTPADVSRSSDVLRVLRRIESHSRSRSGGSLHSRANSASSLRSLWDPPSRAAAHRVEFMSDESSLAEDSRDGDDDLSDEFDSDENKGDWLNMRRPSFPPAQHLKEAPQRQPADANAPASTTASMTAIRDQLATQLQVFQQSMAMHLQNLPQLQMPHMQMPQMPALPPMPMLPDYQAYLHTAPVMQRISSLVPNIRGQRPGSEGEPSPRDTDSKWWDLFSAKESPPPAYEDIYPQKAFDTKQATAVAAAAEFEADRKCEALFDQHQSRSESSRSQEVPALLEIGHKHNITKEQQEQLQRAHAQRLKTGSSDKMLWFVWIPILIFILCAMLASGAPSLASMVSSAFEFVKSTSALVTNSREAVQGLAPSALGVA
ncbi:SPT3 Dosage dependent suppressor of Ty-induced promoter mutations-like protein [Parahypoxylon ruwenzoriense]